MSKMPQGKNKTREQQFTPAQREQMMAELFPLMVGSKHAGVKNQTPYDPTATYDQYFRGGKSTSPKKTETFNNKELAKEKLTGEALHSSSSIASTLLPFLTSAIDSPITNAIPGPPLKGMKAVRATVDAARGPAARVAGDVPFYGGLRPQVASAFQSENPDDRLNALLSLAAITGLDLATDAGVRGLGFLYNKMTKANISPYVMNAMLVAKNNAMTPAYNAVSESINNNNTGRKTAEAIKLVDNFINDDNLQIAYRNTLPVLQDMAYGYGNQRPPTNLNALATNRDAMQRVPNQDNAAAAEILRPLTMTIPKNLPVAREAADEKLADLARGERGFTKDISTVQKGVTSIASKFGSDMRKNLGMAAMSAAPVVGQVASEVINIGDKFGSAMRSLFGKSPLARK
jgi:hypothetical protein